MAASNRASRRPLSRAARRRVQLVVGLAATLALVAACGTTRLKESWKAPEAGPIAFQKVVVIGLAPSATVRRVVENEVAQKAERAEVVPSWTFLSDEQLRDVETVKTAVQQRGFDGAIVFSVVGSTKRETYVPGSYGAPYGSLWGYYPYAYRTAFDPGYVRTDEFVEVETFVYSVPDAKLLWSARSETMNPQSVPDLVDDVGQAVLAQLREDGLVQ